MEIDKNLEIAIKASLKAGKAIMKVYNSDFEIEYKEDESPLTTADKNANIIINSFLLPTGIPIISEENKQTPYSIRRNWNTCWIVDPVDGTKEFIKRNGEFTVNIAYVLNGVPQIGVIYMPVSKTMYFGYANRGEAYKATLSSHEFSLEAIKKNSVLLNQKGYQKNIIKVIGSRSHMSQETIDFIQSIEKKGINVEVVSKGSSLKFCIVAEGNADIYPRFAPTMEWDTAAGQAICKAAGLSVISYDTKAELLYNKENLTNPWFIVS